MAVHFILGGSGRGKSFYLNHRISAEARKNPEQQYIMLVPEQFTMQTQREMVSISDCKGIMNIDVQSFVRLAYRIFGETGAGNIPVLDDMGKTMILRKVLAGQEERLTYFGKNIHKKGYVLQIKSFLSEMLQYGMGAEQIEDMKAAAAHRPVLQMKLQDMEIAYQAFMVYLKENYITSEEVLMVLCDVVSESKLLQDSVITLDGFTGFTPVQYRLLEELLLVCKEMYITVTMDPREELLRLGPPHRLFYMSRKAILKIRELASRHQIEICPEIWTGRIPAESRFEGRSDLASLEQNLFRFPYQSYSEKPAHISLHLLRQPEQEIQFVIAEIMRLREETGCRYRNIAVVTGDMEVYGTLARQDFEQAGLPCFVDQKKSILTHPFVEMIRALTDILITDLSYESVLRYLRGRYCNLERTQIDLLDNFLLATGIRGQKKWQQEWEPGIVFPVFEEAQVQQVKEKLNQIRMQVWDLFHAVQEQISKGKHSVREFAKAYCTFLEEQGFYLQLQQDVETYRDAGDLLLAREYDQVYEIVLGVFDRLVELLGEEEMSLREFKELLETGFDEARVGLIPPGVDQIVFGDMNRTRLAHVDYLFFLGVTDGNIPKASSSGGILSESERSFLAAEEFELAPTARETVYTEQFYLYLNLTKPQKHLYICYPETGVDGVAQNPSYLLERIRKLFPKLELCVEEERQDPCHVLAADGGKGYLIQGLRRQDYSDQKWQELYRSFWENPEGRVWLEQMLEAAFYREKETKISRAAARALYQEVLRSSASGLERFAACQFSFFLRYGLKLSERAQHAVEFFDIGNIVHEALELYTKQLLASHRNWTDLAEDEQHILARQSLNEVVEKYKNGLLYDTERDTYLIHRLRRILERTVWAVTKQISQGSFVTVDSELRFANLYGPMQLVGRVDRLDLLEKEEADYLTIVDYKTGGHTISLCDLYYGLQMQLVIYLKSAVDQRQEHQKKLIIPAGVFYYNIDDPILKEAVPEEQIDHAILKELRMKGLVNEDDPILPGIDQKFASATGELPGGVSSLVAPIETRKNGTLTSKSATVQTKDLETMMQYTQKRVEQMAQEIQEGAIAVNPYRNKEEMACTHCPYHGVCRFDVRIAGNHYRQLKALTEDDALLNMEQALQSVE